METRYKDANNETRETIATIDQDSVQLYIGLFKTAGSNQWGMGDGTGWYVNIIFMYIRCICFICIHEKCIIIYSNGQCIANYTNPFAASCLIMVYRQFPITIINDAISNISAINPLSIVVPKECYATYV